MRRDRWTPLQEEAAPKARRYTKSFLRMMDAELVRQIEAAFVRGYMAGATRDERRGWRARSPVPTGDGNAP